MTRRGTVTDRPDPGSAEPADTATSEPADTATSESTVMRIGELAGQTGLTTRTLRYWEELGLISRAATGARASACTR